MGHSGAWWGINGKCKIILITQTKTATVMGHRIAGQTECPISPPFFIFQKMGHRQKMHQPRPQYLCISPIVPHSAGLNCTCPTKWAGSHDNRVEQKNTSLPEGHTRGVRREILNYFNNIAKTSHGKGLHRNYHQTKVPHICREKI